MVHLSPRFLCARQVRGRSSNVTVDVNVLSPLWFTVEHKAESVPVKLVPEGMPQLKTRLDLHLHLNCRSMLTDLNFLLAVMDIAGIMRKAQHVHQAQQRKRNIYNLTAVLQQNNISP